MNGPAGRRLRKGYCSSMLEHPSLEKSQRTSSSPLMRDESSSTAVQIVLESGTNRVRLNVSFPVVLRTLVETFWVIGIIHGMDASILAVVKQWLNRPKNRNSDNNLYYSYQTFCKQAVLRLLLSLHRAYRCRICRRRRDGARRTLGK